jgi:hypothetical protein
MLISMPYMLDTGQLSVVKTHSQPGQLECERWRQCMDTAERMILVRYRAYPFCVIACALQVSGSFGEKLLVLISE